MVYAHLAAYSALTLAFAPTVTAQPVAQTIYLWSFDYAPKPIHLRAGQPVTLTFVNRSGAGHDFTARRFFASSRILNGKPPGGQIELRPGETKSVTLIPSAGVYKVHCGHFLHKQFGMTDVIIVR